MKNKELVKCIETSTRKESKRSKRISKYMNIKLQEKMYLPGKPIFGGNRTGKSCTAFLGIYKIEMGEDLSSLRTRFNLYYTSKGITFFKGVNEIVNPFDESIALQSVESTYPNSILVGRYKDLIERRSSWYIKSPYNREHDKLMLKNRFRNAESLISLKRLSTEPYEEFKSSPWAVSISWEDVPILYGSAGAKDEDLLNRKFKDMADRFNKEGD